MWYILGFTFDDSGKRYLAWDTSFSCLLTCGVTKDKDING